MSDFEINEYLKGRVASDNKLKSLSDATARKTAELGGQPTQPATWSSKLGLDSGGFVANRVNDAASVVSGAARFVGDITALAPTIAGTVATTGLLEGDYQAYNRVQTGQATEADLTRLNAPSPNGGSTTLEKIQFQNSQRGNSRDIKNATDLTGIVDQTNRAGLMGDLATGFTPNWEQAKTGWDKGNPLDVVKGGAGLISTAVKAGINNPGAVREFALENIPQILSGALGTTGKVAMAAGNAGYAADTYQQGIENYAKANQGQLPPESVRQEMALKAASLAAAEQVGDVVTLGASKAAGIFGKVAEKQAKLGVVGSLTKRVGSSAEVFGTEALTEGYQTKVEGDITGKEASALDIYQGAAVGGLAGSALSGSLSLVSDVVNRGAASQETKVKEATAQEAQQVAIDTGDVSALLDPKSSSFSPGRAVAALAGNSELASATPETKQANLTKAGEIVSDAQAKVDGFKEEVAAVSAEGITKTQRIIGVLASKIAASTDEAEIATLTRVKEANESQLALDQDPANAAQANERLAAWTKHLTEAQEGLKRFTTETFTKDVDVDAEVQSINTATDSTVARASVEKLVNLSMVSPERFTAAQINSLVSNEKNGLSTAERTYLNTITPARLASNQLKTMDKVSQDIYFGSPASKGVAANLGIKDYREQVMSALASGNTQLAATRMNQLNAFRKDHQAKADILAEAWDNGPGTQVVKDDNKVWSIVEGKSAAWLAERSGYTVNGDKLVTNTTAEAEAINLTFAELKAAFVLKRNTQGVTNVQNIPQTANQTQGRPEAQQEGQTTESSGSQAGSNVTGSTNVPVSTGATTASVEPVTSETTSTEVSGDTLSSTAASQQTTVEDSKQSKDSITEAKELVLKALAEKSSAGVPYASKKLAAEFITQVAQGPEDATAKPLASVKDFFSAWKEAPESILSFIKAGKLSDMQKQAVVAFMNTAKSWNKTIVANLPGKTNEGYAYTDAIQSLLVETNGKPDLEQNIKLAISFGAYSWLINDAGKPPMKAKHLAALLGRGESHRPSKAAWNTLGKAGTYQHIIADNIGGSILSALGFTFSKDTPQDYESRLRASLGMHALKMLEDQGLVTRTTVSEDDMAKLREAGLDAQQIKALYKKLGAKPSSNIKHEFYTVTKDTETNKPAAEVKKITESVKGTQGVLDKLFGVESKQRLPSLEPITQVQKFASGTKMGIPAQLKKVTKVKQAREWKVRKDTVLLLDQFSPDQYHSMMGVKSIDEETMHVEDIAGIEAKNAGLVREYELFQGYLSDVLGESDNGLDTPFYLPYNIWKQQRVGIDSNVVNPQASKIVRFLIGQDAWTTTIDPANTELMDSFYLRVAEGLSMKTERSDNLVSIMEVQAKLQEPIYANAIAALVNGVTTEEEKQSVVDAVAAGKANLHTLDVLIGLAAMKKADGKPFTVQMMGEVDGVANGTMLNLVLFGAGTQDILNKGGFFEEGNDFTEYNQWRGEEGAKDIYEHNADKLDRTIQNMFGDITNVPELAAIHGIMNPTLLPGEGDAGSFADRGLIKDALNPIAFGSSTDSMRDGMAETFIGSIYSNFGKIAKIKDEASKQSQLNAYVKHINSLIGDADGHLPVGEPVSFYLADTLSNKSVVRIKQVYNSLIGEAIEEVVKDSFADFLAKRNALNQTARTTWALSNAVREGMRQAFFNDLLAKGELPTNKAGKVIGDLSKAQEAAFQESIKDILPIINSMSAKTDSTRDTGMLLASSERKQNKSELYKNETKFGTPIKNSNVRGKAQQSVNLNGFSRQEDSPGVSTGSAQTHSFDSWTLAMTEKERAVLGIHDAAGDGVAGLKATAQALNKNLWKGLVEYSPLEEAYQSLASVMGGVQKLIEEDKFPPEAHAALQKYIKDNAFKLGISLKGNPFEQLLSKAKYTAVTADQTKLSQLATWQSVSQYSYQGGNYAVTAADRAYAAKKLTELEVAPTEKGIAAAEALGKLMATKPKATTQAKQEQTTDLVPDVQEQGEEFQQAEGDLDTSIEPIFGKLGKPSKVNKALVDAFKAKPVMSITAALDLLDSVLETPYNKLLARMVRRAAPSSTTVHLITPQVIAEGEVTPPNSPSQGWFVGDRINILSTDFVSSGLRTPETLLHELVHAATASVIRKAKEGSKAAESVKALNTLMSKAGKTGAQSFPAAFANLDEFVAYGMTNKAFQDFLKTIEVKRKESVIDGLKEFVSKMVGLLFKGDNKTLEEQANTALAVLIENVTTLMQEGSQQTKGINLSMVAGPMGTVNTYSTLDILNALDDGSLSTGFVNQLKSLLGGIVNTMHGPFGSFKAALMQDQALTPMDVWFKAINTGVAPFAASTQGSPIRIGEQEAFVMDQLEATMREALTDNSVTGKYAYKELSNLYTEASKVIKPTDFNNQAEYDYVFNMELNSAGKSNHLARFAAFGLAHGQFNSLLQKVATNQKQKPTNQTITQRLQSLLERVLELFQEKITKTFKGQAADVKLESLVSQLVDIEAKRKVTLARKATANNPFAPIEKGIKTVTDKAGAKVIELANSSVVKNSSNKFIAGAGALTRVVANDQVDEFVKLFQSIRNKSYDERLGFIAGSFNYLVSSSKKFEGLLRERKRLEGERKDITTNAGKLVLSAFANQGSDIKQDEKATASITSVFMRTGLHYLSDDFGAKDLEALLDSPAAITNAINTYETELDSFGIRYKEHFINKARYLGYFKATGRNKDESLMLNSYNISRLFGTAYQGRITEQQSIDATKVLDKLIALYTLEYTDKSAIKKAKEVLTGENNRPQGESNGVSFVLALHKKMEQDAKERLFDGQEALMQHGYTPDITNSHTEVRVANEVEGKELEKMGYTKISALSRDPSDPNKDKKSIYVLKDAGLDRKLTGIMSVSSLASMGTEMHSGYLNINTATGLENASNNADVLNSRNTGLLRGAVGDLSGGRTYMAPVLNPQGDIVNWRYLMEGKTKDELLERDNRFDRVMGVLAGSMFDKETTTEVNVRVIQALFDDYKAESKKKPEGYAWISPNSSVEEDRQTWAMLPYETREAAKAIWGNEGMYVRQEVRDIVFGYRKLSLAKVITNVQERREINATRKAMGLPPMKATTMAAAIQETTAGIFTFMVEKMLVGYARAKGYSNPEDYAKRAALKVTQSERMWQEFVQEAKDIIVVKTGIVLLGNIKSNISLLLISGVSIGDILKYHLDASRGATAYQKDTEELFKLELQLATGQTNGKEAETKREIIRLKDAIERNPIKELVDAGLLSTIVEDTGEDDDLYSYRSKLTRTVNKYTGKLPSGVKAVGEQVYMGKNTKVYQGLRRVTQLSDFVARYTMYQHLITRKDNPLKKEDAIQQVSDDFVNYDIPMHRGMQYMDDMGLMMFTKYFMRIQRVITRTVKENPARVLASIGLQNYFGLSSNVLDSSWLHHVGNNPLSWGALQYPGTLDELSTVQAGMALLK